MNLVFIFIGGGLGSLARYGTNELTKKYFTGNFPAGTLLANLLSAFILGIFMGWILSHNKNSDTSRLLIATGFCGGFSTFSAFTFETFQLLKTGNTMLALTNILISFLGCLIAMWVGWRIITQG
jgi:CrcB protein